MRCATVKIKGPEPSVYSKTQLITIDGSIDVNGQRIACYYGVGDERTLISAQLAFSILPYPSP